MTNKRKSDNRMQDVFDSNLWVLSEALKRDTPLAAVREMENVMSKKLGAQVLISIEPAQRGFEFTVRADEGGYATFTTEIDADW